MAVDNLTLALNGRISLRLYAEAIANLDALVRALSDEIARGAQIGWELESLEGEVEDRHVNNALLRSVGESPQVECVEQVVRAYGVIGKSLAGGQAIPYPPKIAAPARSIVGILNGAIRSIRFETPEEDATVRTAVASEPRQPNLVAYGAIEGIVQTLSRRGGLRFSLYDREFDRAVSCYLLEGQEDIMRNVWGKRAIVEGRVSRDPETGRPVAIRQIVSVDPVEDDPDAILRAAGALVVPSSMPPPEVSVRRLRDG